MAKLTASIRFRLALLLGGCLSPFYAAAADAPAASPGPLPPPVAADGPPDSGPPVSPRLIITSDSSCPSATAVTEALAMLVPPADWPSGTVRIHAASGTCVVDLASEVSTERKLALPADCGLRATTLALVVATWTGELASEAAGAPILRGPAPGVFHEAPSPLPTSAPVVPVPENELGAGLLLSISGGLAPGVRIDFLRTRAPRGLGWQAGLALPAQRERAAGGGTTSWTRAAAHIAVNGRITLQRFVVSVDAGLAGTYTFTSGHGYSVGQSSQALTGGGVAGARLALSWQRVRLWTDARGYKWLFPQALRVDSPEGTHLASVALPSFDFQWAVGLSYLFR